MASKFKVGDRVETVADKQYRSAKKGATATVTAIFGDRWLGVAWDRNELSGGQCDGNYYPEDFKLHGKPKRKVYIAGPMTGIPDDNFPAFNEAAAVLKAAGLDVFNPADHGSGGEWAEYMKRDIPELLKCDAIVLLDGWTFSAGAQLENHIAVELEMPRYEYNDVQAALELING